MLHEQLDSGMGAPLPLTGPGEAWVARLGTQEEQSAAGMPAQKRKKKKTTMRKTCSFQHELTFHNDHHHLISTHTDTKIKNVSLQYTLVSVNVQTTLTDTHNQDR